MVLEQPKKENYSTDFIAKVEQAKATIVNIRSIRQSKGISPKESLDLYIKGDFSETLYCIIQKMANINSIKQYAAKEENFNGSSFMVGTVEFFVPLGNLVNIGDEITRIEAEIKHLEGFLVTVNKKLSNEKFVANAAKDIVDMEYKKQSDAQTKISKLNQLKQELKK